MKKLRNNKKISRWFIVGFCCLLLWVILFGMQNCAVEEEKSKALLPEPQEETRGGSSDNEVREILERGEENGKIGNFEFVADGTGALREYTDVPGSEPISSKNNIRDPMLFLELQKRSGGGSGAYKGKAVISYYLGDKLRMGSFSSAHNDVSQNKWELVSFEFNGSTYYNPVWIGFFQDNAGAIILITDPLQDYGEGYRTKVSGSVWFKNFLFPSGRNTQGPSACWRISAGPYDCRARILKKGESGCNENFCPKARRTNPYMKLGTFKDLDLIEIGFDINDIGNVVRGTGSVLLIASSKPMTPQVPRGTSSVEEKGFWSGILEGMKLYLRRFLKFFGFVK